MAGRPRYEWDEVKRQRTLDRRGIDFAHIKRFDWASALVAAGDRKEYPERRFVSIGMIDDR